MNQCVAKLGSLIAISVILSSCATVQETQKNPEPSTSTVENSEAVPTKNAPLAGTEKFKLAPARSLEAQRKLDDKNKFKEFSKLEFASDSERAAHYFSLGQAYSLNNETERAVEAYRTTIVYDPNSALVHSRLAAELVKVGNFAEAKYYCARAVELDPKFVDGYLLLAGIQVVAKELDAALATYKRALAIAPDNRDALLYYGTTLAEAGRLDNATTVLSRLVKLDEDSNSQVDPAIAWYYLAKVQTQQDKFNDAANSLRESLKERPGFAKAALFLADIYLAQEKQDKSIAVLEECFKESANPTIAARLSSFYLSQSRFEKAVPYLETVVESDPDNVSSKVRLALVYWQIQWLGKAEETLQEVYSRYPQSNEVAYYLGELELERQRPEQALSYFLTINPEYARYEDAVLRAVAGYQMLKKPNEARAFLQKSILRKSDIVAFHTALARLYEEENKLIYAVKVLESSRSLVEKDENALYYLGYLYDRLGDKANGAIVMEQILKKNPDNANALNYLGYSFLEDNKDIARAESYIMKAVELKPNDPYILDSYGWLLFRQGKTDLALKQIQNALAFRPGEGVIIEHLADIYLNLNMKRKALDAYGQALDNLSEAKDQARVNQKYENVANALGLNSRLPASRPNLEANDEAKVKAEK